LIESRSRRWLGIENRIVELFLLLGRATEESPATSFLGTGFEERLIIGIDLLCSERNKIEKKKKKGKKNEINNNRKKNRKPESFPIHWIIVRSVSDSLSHLLLHQNSLDHEEIDNPEPGHHCRFHKDRAFHNPRRTSANPVIHSTISPLLRQCGI
jgi:hypothetical protein